jgi:hypothetical protein
MMENVIIGLDFDGTCVTHEFPNIGEELPHCITTLKKIMQAGGKIVLNTMRSDRPEGQYLTEAVNWLKERGIELYGVNNNPEQSSWTTSPKVYAHIYIDDAAIGTPLTTHPSCKRLSVDWHKVEQMLAELP